MRHVHPLVARIRRMVRRRSLIPTGSRVLVAVSGGADSMALLHALRDLQETGEVDVAGIAHVNHQLRGVAADDDEAFCRDVAARLGLPIECERIDVRAVAAQRGLSIEAAGHVARYDFFERAAARLGAARVALGHTRDDQAETFLLRLLRGAGPRGLGGMHPSVGVFIRPMLDCSRRHVRRFVADRGIAFREDATNRDETIARNLVRHTLIPALARMSPGIVRILSREADIARDDAQFLETSAADMFNRLARRVGNTVRLDTGEIRDAPPALARRVVTLAMAEVAAGRFIGFDHVERVLDLIRSGRPGTLNLPGQCAENTGTYVLFRETSGEPADRPNLFRFSLSIPGEVVSPLGWTVSAERAVLADGHPASPGGARPDYPRSWALLDGVVAASSLQVRNWTPGDRFRPLGMSGTRKLQDFFVDRKVPRAERARLPIVVDDAERVVWVAGHGIAEDFRVTSATSDVVILKLKYWRHGT